MKKRFSAKLSLLVSLLLLAQLMLSTAAVLAASTMLPPSNLAVQQVTPDDIKLSWSAVYGASGYNVYGITEGQMTLLGQATTTSYSVNNLAEGSYQYVVSTLGPDGESGPCAPVSVDIVYPDMAAPTLTHTFKNVNDIVLNWTAPQYAETYALYQLSQDGQRTLLTSGNVRTYTISNAAAGNYTYAVTAAQFLYGESPLSAPLEVAVVWPTMTAPGGAGFSFTNVNDLNLRWNAVANAIGYKIYQIVNGEKQLKSTVSGTSVVYANQAAGDYVYEIHSYSDRYGESAEGSQVSVTVSDVIMAPPANFAYKLQNLNDIVLTWSAAANATNYNIYEILDGQPVLKSTVTGTTVTYPKAAAGTYTYEIRSNSSRFGESAQGSQVSFTLDGVAMAAPDNFTYAIANGNDIKLNWSAVSNADNYKVYQVVNGIKSLKGSPAAATLTFSNQPAGNYTFEVHSNSTRFGESTEGSQVTFSLVHPVIQPPQNLIQKTLSATSFSLNWDVADYAASYKVYQVVNGQKVLKNSPTAPSVSYTNVSPGDYTYEVHTVTTRFGESPAGTQLTFTMAGEVMQAPGNPKSAVTNGNDISLSWTAVQNATSYKVYQIANGQKVLKSTVTGLSVNYSNQPEGDYHFVVHSVSSLLGESPEGADFIFPLVFPTMAAPGNFTSKLTNVNDVILTWTNVPYANNYKVYELVDGDEVAKAPATTALTVTLSNQPAGDHTYVVHSVSTRFGESPEGSQVSFTLEFPVMQAPANLVHSIGNGNDITLTWKTPVTYATGYNVYQIVAGQPVFKKTVTAGTMTFTNMPIGDYMYEVRSFSNRFGESPESSKVSFTLTFPVMQAPTGLSKSIANGNDITLKWNAGVQYANGYNVYQIIDGQPVLKSKLVGAAIASVAYPKMAFGDYTFEVRAYSDRFGESVPGSSLTFKLAEQTMQAPTGFTQTIANGNDVTLKWNTVTYATAYKVYQIVDAQPVLKKTVTGNSTTTAAFPRSPEGNYVYEVHSFSDRFGESDEGGHISFDLVFPTMEAPAGLSYTIANGNDVTLKWNAVIYATGYKVYQIIDGQPLLKQTITSNGTTTAAFPNSPARDYVYEVHSFSDRFGDSPEGSQLAIPLVFPIMQAPAAPRFTITNGNDFTLSWTASTYATAYRVYEIVGGQKQLRKTVTTLPAVFPNMPEADYSYEIHSYSDRFGESPVPADINFRLNWPVLQPSPLKANITNVNNITFTWTTATWANEYRLYEIIDGTRMLLYKGTALTYKLNNLNEDSHQYELKVYNTRYGESAASSPYSATIVFPEMQAPAANVRVLDDKTSALIWWNFVTYANGYNVYEIVDGKSVLVAEKVNNLSTTLTNLPYADHEYYVTSYSNSFGESEKSNTVIAKLIIDTKAPVTTADAATGWSNKDQVVNLTASDDITGVKATYISVNDGDYTPGTSLTVSEEGITKVSFYSVDQVGNTEAAHTIDVKVDKTAPVTQANGSSDWSQSAALNLTATDGLSGAAKTFYSVNGSEYTEGTSLTVDREGTSEVSFYSVDEAGNKESGQTIQVKLDRTAPATTANAPDGWVKEAVKLSFNATDAQSGVTQTMVSVDGAAYEEGTSITIEQEGVHQVSFYSVDVAGNIEDHHTVEVKIDHTAPVTTTETPTSWAKQTVTLELMAADAHSGVAGTSYSVNGSEYVQGTSVTVDQEGINEVSFYSVDAAGNKESAQTIQVMLDDTAPATTSQAPEGWSKEAVTVKLSATDAHSGVAKTLYSIDGADYMQGNSFTLSEDGTHRIAYYSVDMAGNIETANTVTVKIDKTAPVILMDVAGPYKLGTPVLLKYAANDDLSGIVSERMTVIGQDSTTEVANGSPFTPATPGTYTVTVTAHNAAGLTATIEKQLTVYIPVTVAVTPTVIKGNNGVFTVRVGLPAGFSSQGFDLNSVALNGMKALTSNNGYDNQAKNGQFKFERSDFSWTGPEVKLEFRGYVNGYLVMGQTTVKVQK